MDFTDCLILPFLSWCQFYYSLGYRSRETTTSVFLCAFFARPPWAIKFKRSFEPFLIRQVVNRAFFLSSIIHDVLFFLIFLAAQILCFLPCYMHPNSYMYEKGWVCLVRFESPQDLLGVPARCHRLHWWAGSLLAWLVSPCTKNLFTAVLLGSVPLFCWFGWYAGRSRSFSSFALSIGVTILCASLVGPTFFTPPFLFLNKIPAFCALTHRIWSSKTLFSGKILEVLWFLVLGCPRLRADRFEWCALFTLAAGLHPAGSAPLIYSLIFWLHKCSWRSEETHRISSMDEAQY